MSEDLSNPVPNNGAGIPTPSVIPEPSSMPTSQVVQSTTPATAEPPKDFVIPEVVVPIDTTPTTPEPPIVAPSVPVPPATATQLPITDDPFSLQKVVDEQLGKKEVAVDQKETQGNSEANQQNFPRIEIMPEHLMAPVHTLKTDISDVLASGNTSVARIAIQEESDKSKNQNRNRLEQVLRVSLIILIISFVSSSLSILGYALYKGRTPQTAGVVVEQGPISLISSNTQSELDLTGADQDSVRGKFIALIKEKVGILRPHTIEFVRLVRRVTEGAQTYVLEVPGSQVIRLAAGENSARFTSLLDGPSFFGLHTDVNTHGFWILKTSDFQDSFAALLNWEKFLPANLFPLLTGEELPSDLTKQKWEDAVIQNTDVRVLRDGDGTIRMIYSFMGTTDTIFIGTNEAQFLEVFTRLKNPGSALQ